LESQLHLISDPSNNRGDVIQILENKASSRKHKHTENTEKIDKVDSCHSQNMRKVYG